MMPLTPPLSPLVQSALDASAQGDSDTAISLFVQATRQEPDSAIPHYLLAAEYAELGNVEAAEHSFANALLLQPELRIVRFQLGLLQYYSGKQAIAFLTWQPLLVSELDDPLARFVVGFGSLNRGDASEARSHFEQGLLLNTANPALNADIQAVIASMSIEHAAPGLAAEPGDDAMPNDDAEGHVLLSNYQQNGSLH